MTLTYISPSATTQVRAFLTLNGTPSNASPYTLTAGADNGVSKQHTVTPLNANSSPLADGVWIVAFEEDGILQPGYYPYKIVNGVEVPVDALSDADRIRLFATMQASAYTAPDNTAAQAAAASAATIESRLTSARATKLDTVALTSNLTPIATSAQVTTAQNAILTQGNAAWTTATAAGLGLPAITTAIAAIPTQTLASGDPALIATAVKAALDAQLDKIIDLNEADVVKTLTTYVKNRRGTQTALFPSKTVAATGDNVSIRQL